MHDLGLLVDLLWVLAIAVLVVLGVAKLRLPSIAGFILAGALIGPHAAGLVRDLHGVQTLAEVGVILLLFGVGLEMPLPRLQSLWKPMLVAGTAQVLLTLLLAFACARALGFELATAITFGMLIVPSSTAIVLRVLGARGELEAPHGRLMLAVLLFQDLCVLPMMLALPALAAIGGATGGAEPLAQLGRAALLLTAIVVAAALIVPRVLSRVVATRQRDAFVLSVLVICLGMAYAASFAGVSLALGAFLGGVVVAASPYRHQANAELAPMREVLASLFFVSVGMLLDARLFVTEPLPVFGLLAATFAGKALVMLIGSACLRAPLRVAVIASLGLAQLGEFSLVLASSAQQLKLLPAEQAPRLLAVATLSMVLTPLALALGPKLAALAARLPFASRAFGASTPHAKAPQHYRDHVVVAGIGLAGEALLAELARAEQRVVAVDLNADTVRALHERGVPAYFGDIGSHEMLEHVQLTAARELVLLINDPAALEHAVVAARTLAPRIGITARVRYRREAERLHALGADEVIAAEVEAGQAVVTRVLARLSRPAGASEP